jgi:hypothetical protein
MMLHIRLYYCLITMQVLVVEPTLSSWMHRAPLLLPPRRSVHGACSGTASRGASVTFCQPAPTTVARATTFAMRVARAFCSCWAALAREWAVMLARADLLCWVVIAQRSIAAFYAE